MSMEDLMVAAALRLMLPREHRRFFKQLQQDFHAGEYPPYFVLHRQLMEGSLEGLVFSLPDGRDLAYALNAAKGKTGLALISYYAVLPSYRGKGVGSSFLEAIAERYGDRRGIVVEVEKPEEARDNTDRDIRERRIRFYERAGFRLVPEVDYSIWGIPMHLMIRPLCADHDRLVADLPERMHDVYLDLMGKAFVHRMKARRIS